MQSKQLFLSEIYSAIQGEGPIVGVRQLFIRLSICDLRCKWCDTPNSLVKTKHASLEISSGSRQFQHRWLLSSGPGSGHQHGKHAGSAAESLCSRRLWRGPGHGPRRQWLDQSRFQVNPASVEKRFVNRKYRYAGTIDRGRGEAGEPHWTAQILYLSEDGAFDPDTHLVTVDPTGRALDTWLAAVQIFSWKHRRNGGSQ